MRVYERMEFICGELERKNIPPEFMQQANQLTNDGARRILLRFVPYEQEIEKQIGFLQREFENIKSAVACARKFPAIISTAMFVLVVNMAMEISFVVRFATILSTLAWFHSDSLINTCTEALERFRQLKPGDKEATSQ